MNIIKNDVVNICCLSNKSDDLLHFADAVIVSITDKSITLELKEMRNEFLCLGSHLFGDDKQKVRFIFNKHAIEDYFDGFVIYYKSSGNPTFVLPKNTNEYINMSATLND